MENVNKQLLDAVKHCHGIFDQYVSHHLAKPDYDKAAANERHRAICAEAIAAAEQAQQPSEDEIQAAFESWLYRTLPSGDAAEVQRKFEESSDYLELFEKQQHEPVAWVRFCSDGCYEGPIMNSDSRMDSVRRASGAWTPLYTAQPPAVAVPVFRELTDDELWEIRNHVAINEVMRDDDSKTICVKHGRAIVRAMLAAAPQGAVAHGWIDPNDKTQKQFLPHIGEPVLFCHGGVTYYGIHTGGSFKAGQGVTARTFGTWDCMWMYPPAAASARSNPPA